MAQQQFTNYQSDILSFELREAMLGILNSGRYAGYDSVTSNGTPSAGSIPIRLSHDPGASKSTHTASPTLETGFGMAITPQGIIIHEDQDIDINIDESSEANFRWDLIYMEHTYVDVAGDNPATYDVVSGTNGGSKPSVPNSAIQTPLIYVYIPSGTTTFSTLRFYPTYSINRFGDHNIMGLLFGPDYEDILETSIVGSEPSDPNNGIIGNRQGSWDNFDSGDSITNILNAIDNALTLNNNNITSVGGRAIDNASWGSLTDNTNYNASTSTHGLLPRLSGETDEFLRGDGTWANVPPTFNMIGSTADLHYNSNALGGTLTLGSTQDVSISSQVPVGTTQVLLSVEMQVLYGTSNSSGRYGKVYFSAGGSIQDRTLMVGPSPLSASSVNGSPSHLYSSALIICSVDSSRQIRLSYGNYSGSTVDWLRDLRIKVMGYR